MKIELGYKSERFEVNKETIKEFYLLENRRRLKEDKVLSMKSNLRAGIHFESPIVINQLSKKRVIDGQHRITAMQRIIKEQPDIKIIILLVSYKDKTMDEERQIFHRWNSGSRQTREDYLMMFESEIPLIKMVKNFPMEVSVYHEKGKLQFKVLVSSYLAARDNVIGGTHGTPEDFIEYCKELGRNDYNFMDEFWQGYKIHICNSIESKNVFCTGAFIKGLIYIYYWNQDNKKFFWERVKNRVIQNEKIIMLSKTGGRTAIEMITKIMSEEMSRGYKEEFIIEPRNRAIPEGSKEAKKRGKETVKKLLKTFGGVKPLTNKQINENLRKIGANDEENEDIETDEEYDPSNLEVDDDDNLEDS
jgi:hypothetical protein